ncbi:uncharacterized protein LOC132543432 [Ylistrum balloti]|uniref:uncharacterized protein LOC132543432 n=1 Tax=Ylistrum balloti TaxID=509963 RepID=UPI002905C2C7|nr:uncharacterized protein LOC132543432 [Ylistrum balloti]
MGISTNCNDSGVQTMFQRAIIDIVLGVTFVLVLVQSATGIGCPKGGPDSKYIQSMEICKTRSLTGSSILLDFYPARSIPVDECDCTILVYQGNKLSVSPVSTPGYVGCGSEIHIQRYLPRGEARIISCRGATTFPGLAAGNTLTISLKRVQEPFDTSYCYRLDIDGKAASMSLICEDAKTTSTVAMTTSRTLITTVNDEGIQTGNHSSQVEVVDAEPIPSLSGLGTIAVTTVTSVLAVYSTIITILYIMLRRKRHQQEKTYNEIYEEIPPRATVQNRNSRLTRMPSICDDRELPALPHLSVQRQFSEYNADMPPPSANSVSKQTHWNWTYQEKMADNEHNYINQPF